jgi:predicted deacylase
MNVLRQFEMQGVYPLNESVAIGRSRDKLRLMQLLARDGIGLPVSTIAHAPKQTEEVLDLAGGAPVVIKLLEGTQGIGVEVVRRLLRGKNLERWRGPLIVMPIVNTFGFLNHSRYLPDRRDLNRCFPGSPNGSRCSLGIDLYSAAVNRMNLPLVRISANNRYALDLAHVFGAPVILTSALCDGSLRQEVKKLGVDILLYEAGEGMRFEEMSVRAGVAGILRVLKSTGMLPLAGIAGPKAKSLLCSRSTWLRPPTGGLLRMFKAKGDVVKENDVVAAISDPFGDEEIEVVTR